MTPDTRLAIVGGGPVGLVTALIAADAGLDPVVIEPRATPIDKACGEGLMPGALRLVRELDLDPPGAPLRGIAYVQGAKRAEHLFAGEGGRGVERTVLHATIAARVAQQGIPVVAGRVDAVEQHDACVTLSGPGLEPLTAGYVVGADGLHSAVRELVGLTREPQRASRRRYGLRRHYALAPWSDLVEVRWTPDVEFYVTPLGPRSVGVALLGPRGVDFGTALAAEPELRALLSADARGESPDQTGSTRGAGPLLQRTSARTRGRVLLVGDASGYVDALTGEGLRLGFAQARAAVSAIIAGDPHGYEREWAALTRGFRGMTSGLVAAARSPLRTAIVPAAVLLPGVYGAIVERLAR
ncbi:NAD(P)/FAD-dependent oxidoreductase [Humibacter ginsenosidimutans]|uniref:NAD(P)/FAD-dependent oxidoreductase n=1 Tax=Humibacter ginsenosidimutans TaxID=2599293 RepID=UPI00143DD6CA|nr:NAD(P)/FAD-dependent oxidoreductase [Humibacter ginsenosidimutans]